MWSGNRERHRLSHMGNRQLNVALHRIAITQAHYLPEARDYLQRRRQAGDTSTESIRVLKRRLSDVVYRALRRDAHPAEEPQSPSQQLLDIGASGRDPAKPGGMAAAGEVMPCWQVACCSKFGSRRVSPNARAAGIRGPEPCEM